MTVKEALGALALFTAHATLKIIDRPDFLNFAKTRLIGLGFGLWGWQEQERRADTADHATHDLAFAAGEIDIHKDEMAGFSIGRTRLRISRQPPGDRNLRLASAF